MKIFLAMVMVLAFLFVGSGAAQEIKIVDVVDGDTLLLENNGVLGKYYLYGADAPEIGQEYSQKAIDLAKKIIEQDKCNVKIILKVDDAQEYTEIYCYRNGDLACKLIHSGVAFYDRRIKNNDHNSKYINSEKIAKQNKSGIWSSSVIQYPWDYRTANKITEQEVIEQLEKLNAIIPEGGNSRDEGSLPYDNYGDCYAEELAKIDVRSRSPEATLVAFQEAKVMAAQICAGRFGKHVTIRRVNVIPRGPSAQDFREMSDKIDRIERSVR